MFLLVSTHFTATQEFRFPLPHSSTPVSGAPSQLSREISHQTWSTACALFTPSNSEQRSLPTYYRGCWHVVSRSFFSGYRHYRSRRKSFSPRRASSLTRRRCIRVSPIVQDSPLLPPVGVCPCFSASVAVCPLRPATDQSPGRPLPCQLANRPRAPLPAHCCFLLSDLCGISSGFPELFPTRR